MTKLEIIRMIGDVLTEIDGMSPKAWADAVLPRYDDSLPNVTAADWAHASMELSTLIAAHASTSKER